MILIGEMRDAETFQACLGAAETGHCGLDAMEKTKELGREIARQGAVLVTGATTGVPLWATMGAKEAGGISIGFSPAVNLAVRFSDSFGMFGMLSTSYLTATTLQSTGGYNIPIPDKVRDTGSADTMQKSAKDVTADIPISALNIKFCYYF